MPIWSVALFGSRAREDHEPTSDTDVLLVTSESRPRHIFANNISFSLYPARHLYQKARSGDLFVCHLVTEAKVLLDEKNTFEKIRHEFRLRDSYTTEITMASELGWFLVRHGKEFENINTANRRIAWCVRTILIARTAEARKPVFAAKALVDFAKSSIVAELIACKTSNIINNHILNNLSNFLNTWGNGDIKSKEKSPLKYFRHFKKTGNSVAMQTYRHGWTMPADTYI